MYNLINAFTPVSASGNSVNHKYLNNVSREVPKRNLVRLHTNRLCEHISSISICYDTGRN